MHTDNEIRRRIMARVYWVYAIRQIAKPTVTSIVSVKHVIANVMGMPSVSRVADFFLSAFVQTEFVVQTAVVLAALVLIWSVIDLIRTRVRIPAHA
jgi:hypothetical protein